MLTKNNVSAICELPLHYLSHASYNAEQASEINLEEINGLRHYTLRGDSKDKTFNSAIKEALNVALPVKPKQTCMSGRVNLFWMSPDEWLMVCSEDDSIWLEEQLHTHLTGHYALIDNSSGQTLLRISGTKVHSLLMHSCVYDFSPNHFKLKTCVQTKFAQASALIFKRDDNVFDLFIRRSFADYIGAWCLDASHEYNVCLIK